MNKKNIILLALISFLGLSLNAQEYISAFSYHNENDNINSQKRERSAEISLPFFDDFTDTDIYPNTAKWQSNKVLVNSGFPMFPTNFNAATFDVLDANGKVYSHASSSPFVADSLMSLPISLYDGNNKLSVADSLYLSFYYQPQGHGDAPDENDSLVLMIGYAIDTFDIQYASVSVKDMLAYMGVDTIHVGDILYHDMTSSCNQDMYTISEEQYTAADSTKTVDIPCDTLFYTEMKWFHLWSTPGISLDTTFLLNNNDNYFKQLMIPLDNEDYFVKDNIVLLFYNYATMPTSMYPNDRSNMDNWNIDFVYLDKNRSYDDTSYPMLTFSEKSPSLLKRYQSMPYRQYKNNPTVAMKTDYNMYISNLDTATYVVKYSCNIKNMNNAWSYDYSSEWSNLLPFAYNGFQSCEGSAASQACPALNNFLFDMDDSMDTTSYLITHILTTDSEVSGLKCDTLYGKQSFHDYYAYDDGVPERGYGVVPDDSYFASQFTISSYDTLCGVHLLFNRTHNDANYDFFDIVVWNDNNGRPGNEMYRLKNQRPEWSDDKIYEFHYYPFDEVLKVNGTIYVGIMQHSRESINIGFDTSADNSQYNFYETGGGWENSSMPGSLMIRPVMGGNYVVEDNAGTKQRLGLYPVPSDNVVNISELSAQSCDEIFIYDMTGRVVKRFNNDVNLNVADLSNGVYMIRVITGEGKVYTEKFLISR